ncbi:hypothetical protein EAO71_26680 [Streptomyces sp. ms191]|nr:hypothetical protein EAO71_26680 [Streptomyces sp. ms191]
MSSPAVDTATAFRAGSPSETVTTVPGRWRRSASVTSRGGSTDAARWIPGRTRPRATSRAATAPTTPVIAEPSSPRISAVRRRTGYSADGSRDGSRGSRTPHSTWYGVRPSASRALARTTASACAAGPPARSPPAPASPAARERFSASSRCRPSKALYQRASARPSARAWAVNSRVR